MSLQVPSDDRERMERVIEFVAEHLNVAPLKQYIGTPQELRLPPPAFRYQLMDGRRARRISASCCRKATSRARYRPPPSATKGIARCVLIGQRAEILQVAEAQGVTLPESVEIIDPNEVRGRYVPPMVELRKSKGLNAPMAEQQLEDNVVMGTMMLALDEVDGLVSGAVHTTANTIRPPCS